VIGHQQVALSQLFPVGYFHYCCFILHSYISERYPEIQWTETHGMMVVMGGFEVLKEGPDSEPQKMRLTVPNIEANGLDGCEADISTITEDMIKDKSKADAIAKAVVILQTGWFVVQCAARVSQRLPMTHDLGPHCLCFHHILFLVEQASWCTTPNYVAC
jgi:hypothetical protein